MSGMRALMDAGVHAQFVRLHRDDSANAHGGARFFPWHRAMLVEFEHALRTLVDPDIALGYWDWASDAGDPAASRVWSETLLGGASPGACIPDGPFAGVMAAVNTPHCVVRNFYGRSAGGMLGHGFVDPDVIRALVGTAGGDWATFASAAERVHGDVHVGVGAAVEARPVGDMMPTAISPNDPAFFVHHAFVDAWWADRQVLVDATEYSGLHGGAFVSPTERLDVFNTTVADTFDLPCVAYAPPVVARTAAGRGFAPSEASGSGPPLIFEFNKRRAARNETAIEATRDDFARSVGMSAAAIEVAKTALAAIEARAAAARGKAG